MSRFNETDRCSSCDRKRRRLETDFLERNLALIPYGVTPERCLLYKEALQTLTHPKTKLILNIENYLVLSLGGETTDTARIISILRRRGIIEQVPTPGIGAAHHLWRVHFDK